MADNSDSTPPMAKVYWFGLMGLPCPTVLKPLLCSLSQLCSYPFLLWEARGVRHIAWPFDYYLCFPFLLEGRGARPRLMLLDYSAFYPLQGSGWMKPLTVRSSQWSWISWELWLVYYLALSPLKGAGQVKPITDWVPGSCSGKLPSP